MKPRLLVLRPGAIGDTLLTAPALAALRRRFSDHLFVVASNRSALPVLGAMGLADVPYSFDSPAVTRLFMPREPDPDDEFVPISAAVAWAADPDGVLEASLRRRGAAEVLVVPSRPALGEIVHVGRHLMRALAPLGIVESDPTLPRIRPTIGDRQQADVILLRSGLEETPFAIVQPGSGSPTKNWPAERFADVIDRLRADDGLPTLLLAGPADDSPIERIATSLARPVPVVANAPLLVIASLMQRARSYLGNDSGLGHLAGLAGAPTLILFGPTDPALWLPLGPRVRCLRADPLADLEVETVLDALREMLGG